MVDGIGKTPPQTFSDIAGLARKGRDSISAWQRSDGSVKLFTLPKMFAKIERFFMPEAANRRQALAKSALLDAIEAQYGNAMVDKVLTSFGGHGNSGSILNAGTTLSSGMVKDMDDVINNREIGGAARRGAPTAPWKGDLVSPEHRDTDVKPLNDEIEELKASGGKRAAQLEDSVRPLSEEIEEKESTVNIRPSSDDDEKVNIVTIGPATLPLEDDKKAPSLKVGSDGAWVAEPKLPSPDRVFRDFLKKHDGKLAPLAENSLATLKARARNEQAARGGAPQNRPTVTIQINYSEAGKAIREAFEAKGAAALDGMSENEIAELAQSAMDKYVQSILDAGDKGMLKPNVREFVSRLLDPDDTLVDNLIDNVLDKRASAAKPWDDEGRALAKEIKALEQQFEALKEDIEPLLDKNAIDDIESVRINLTKSVRNDIQEMIARAGDKLSQMTRKQLFSLVRHTVKQSLRDKDWSAREAAAKALPEPPDPAKQQAEYDKALKGRAKANAMIGRVFLDKIKHEGKLGDILKAARDPERKDKLGDKSTMPQSARDGGVCWDEALSKIVKAFEEAKGSLSTLTDNDKSHIAVQVVKDYIKSDG